MIRTVQGKGNISYLCVGSRIWPGDLQIILGRENTHRQRKKEKATKSQTHSTNRHWGVSMFMTLNSHLDSPPTHTHTCRAQWNVCTCCGPHTAEQICLKARSCVYHSLHPAHRNICEQAALFCVCFLYAYVHIRMCPCASVQWLQIECW